MATVVLTDPNSKTTLAIARSLARSGHQVLLAGPRLSRVGVSRHASSLGLSELNQSHHLDELAEKLDSFGVDVLVPIGGRSIWLLSRYQTRIPPNVRLEIASASSIALALDKTKTRDEAKSVGVRTPKSFASSDAAAKFLNDKNAQIVVKSPHELAKAPPIYVSSPLALSAAISTQEQRTGIFPMLTEYIEGDGVGFCALYRRGVLVDFYMHRRLRETPSTGGASTFAETVFFPEVAGAGKALLDSLQWHGVAMVEFKLSEAGAVLLEINPKFWGSYQLGQHAGVDFAKSIVEWRPASDTELEETKLEPTYPIGVQFSWLLDGDIGAVRASGCTYVGLARDVAQRRVGADICATDPLPDLFRVGAGLLGRFLAWTGLRRTVMRALRVGIRGSLRRVLTERTGVPLRAGFDVSNEISIGPQPGRIGLWVLRRRGFTHVISVRESMRQDLVSGYGSRLTLLHVPMREHAEIPRGTLRGVASKISDIVSGGGRVYVHCREGVGRAPLAVAAYLVLHQQMEPEAALSLLSAKRPDVAPNVAQIEALEAVLID